MTGTHDELDELLEAFDRDRSYTTERLIKENELERTELVRDARGMRFVRKYITVDPDRVHPYERLTGIDCPYLQKVHEARRIGGKLAVVCEYVEGLDVRTFVQKFGALGRETALRYAIDLCEALRVLHELPSGNVVHRDVSPGNIIISNGKAVLIDLGIARMRNTTASKDTHIWGTSGYAAPEQFGFRQTDARADIYGLGMCLRFMLTGAEPDDTKAALPADLARFVERATDMDPQDRFTSARQMRDAALMLQGSASVGDDAGAYGGSGTEPVEVGGWGWRDGTWEPVDAAQPGQAIAQDRPSSSGRRIVTGAVIEEKLTGLTQRSQRMNTLWRVWQVLAVATVFVLTLGGVTAMGDSDLPGRKIGYATMVVFWFWIPFLTSANFLNINDRIPWFRTYRHIKLFAVQLASSLVWIAIVLILVAFNVPVNPPG